MKNCVFITNFAVFQASFLVLGSAFNWCFCLVLYFLNFICWWHECKSWKKTLFDEMFLSYIWFWVENCFSELTDVTGQLKTTVQLLGMQLLPLGFTVARLVLQKSFIIYCLDLFLLDHLFSTFQTVPQTLELFFFSLSLLLTFYDISDKFAACLYFSSVLLIKAAIALSSSFSLPCPGYW